MVLSQRGSLEVHVNGAARGVAPGACVADLLATLELGGRRVAVAVNGRVVPRAQFVLHALEEGDRIEILEAVGGG